MRQDEVNILSYLPKFLAKDTDFKAVNDADSREHERIRLLLQKMFKQLFLRSDEQDETQTWNLELWERFLGIDIDKTKSYQRRLNEILIKINSNQTTTISYMQTLVNKYIADKSGVVTEENGNNAFSVVFNDGMVTDYEALEQAINLYIPAHLGHSLNIETRPRNPGGIYFKGCVSMAQTVHINADTGYNIVMSKPSNIAFKGVVSIARDINIKADLKK